MSIVAVVKTKPENVLEDYRKVMELADYKKFLPQKNETILKLNLSWSLYYPACSTQPWQLDGILKTMTEEGYKGIHPMENETVVTDVWKGAKGNKWLPVLKKYGLKYEPLTEVKWIPYKPKAEMLALDEIFPDGNWIPETFIGKNVVHPPTIKCVHPDTQIFLADGSLVKIKDLVEEIHNKGSVEITDDKDFVATSEYNLFTLNSIGKLTLGKAIRFWKTPAPTILYTVKTRTGREIVVSGKHPFLTPKGWKQAQDLESSEFIAVSRNILVQGVSQLLPQLMIPSLNPDRKNLKEVPFAKSRLFSGNVQKEIIEKYVAGSKINNLAQEYSCERGSIRRLLKKNGVSLFGQKRRNFRVPMYTTKQFWRWVGYMLAEGNIHLENSRSYKFSFANENKKIQEDFIQITESLFNITPKSYMGNDGQLIFTSLDLKLFLEQIGFPFPFRAEFKTVPRILYKCPNEEIIEFFNGFIDGDGHIDKWGVLSIKIKNKHLASDLQLLLLRLGVISSIKETKNKIVKQNGCFDYKTYSLLLVCGDDMRIFGGKLSLLIDSKKVRLKNFLAKGERNSPSNWDNVPLDGEMFKHVREGLGLSKKKTGKASTVGDIESGKVTPSRFSVAYFITLFEKEDKQKLYSSEIDFIKFLASKDFAWDKIEMIYSKSSEVSYLYDLSVLETNSFIGNGIILHNTHGHTMMTGSIKNAFGGLITKKRHHCHARIDQVLVDLLSIQKEIHPGIFAVMDGTVAGDGAGPRTMIPKVKNYILASGDQVAIDAISAKMMGYDPMKIKFIKLAHDRGLGCGDVDQIEIVGEDISQVNFHFSTNKSPVIFWDQMLRKGPLSFVEPMLFHTGLFKGAIFGSAFYHDYLWYNLIGRERIRKFKKTSWGKLWKQYRY